MTFTWTQLDAIKLGAFNEDLVSETGNASFRAPFVNEDKYSFKVTVSDMLGYRTAEQTITLNVAMDEEQTADESSSSGSMFVLLFGLMGILVRRRIK